MRLRLEPRDEAFRADMRAFFTSGIPQDIRHTVASGHELSKSQIVRSMRAMNTRGIAVPNWPVEWGGRNWTTLQRHIWHQEMELACVPQPLPFNASMVGPVIASFGSDELKRRFLPATANLDIWWAQGFSEPDAGSDLASLRTSAIRDGDTFVVNGQKTWTTLGQYADWIFVLVRTDRQASRRQQGISFLLIDMATPGVTVRPIQLIDRSNEVNEVFFEDVRVPVTNLVGKENDGWQYAKFLLGNERVGVAPVGGTKRLLAQAKDWAGSQLDDPLIAAEFARLENDLLALEVTALRVVADSVGGAPHPASSVLKLRGTELQQAVTELVMDLAGTASLASSGESGAAGWAQVAAPRYLNFRKASIYGGSNEVQRQIIATQILGL